MDISESESHTRGLLGRLVLPIGVSLVLATIATLYPPWAIVSFTVPIAVIVSVTIAQDTWRWLCIRCCAAILLLGIEALAAQGDSGTYGAAAAALPAALASLFFALCSALPEGNRGHVRLASIAAGLSAAIAALLVVVIGMDALFAQASVGNAESDVVPYALLLPGAPAIILSLRLVTAGARDLERQINVAAALAFVAAVASTIVFGGLRLRHPGLFILESLGGACAAVLLMQCFIAAARHLECLSKPGRDGAVGHGGTDPTTF